MFWFSATEVMQNDNHFKGDDTSFLCLIIACMYVHERIRVCEQVLLPEPKKGWHLLFQDLQYLFSGVRGCFMLDAIVNREDHRVHFFERPGQ